MGAPKTIRTPSPPTARTVPPYPWATWCASSNSVSSCRCHVSRQRCAPCTAGATNAQHRIVTTFHSSMGSVSGPDSETRYSLGRPAHFCIRRHRYRSDKAITLAIPRLDETLRLPVVANGSTYGLQTVFNCGITDSLSRPYLFTQFLLCNHTVAVRQKIGKHLEHFWPQSNRLASPA